MATVVAGCYERFLFGFDAAVDGDAATLRRSFYVPVHSGPVKCVAAAAPYVVTGGADDVVHLFDVANHADLGFLMSPGDGAVTALALYAPPDPASAAGGGRLAPTHMLSGAADGAVTIWSAGGDWAELKTVADHGAAITGLTVHDSGRAFVSTDAKGGLRLWSLVKGKAQFKTRLPTPADAAAFGPAGAEDAYALLCGDAVTVHSVGGGEGAGGVTTLTGAGRQLCAAWLDAHTLATGGEAGTISLWDVRAGGGPVGAWDRAHAARVKGVAPLPAAAGSATVLSSAGGDGAVRLWDWRRPGADALASAGASGARITCAAAVAAAAPSRAGEKKTPQQKSRRAKREAAAAAAAAPPPPPPTSPAPAARPEVKLPNAKARRKLLRAQLAAAKKEAAKSGAAPPPPPPVAPSSAPAGKFAGANERKRGAAKKEDGGGKKKKKKEKKA